MIIQRKTGFTYDYDDTFTINFTVDKICYSVALQPWDGDLWQIQSGNLPDGFTDKLGCTEFCLYQIMAVIENWSKNWSIPNQVEMIELMTKYIKDFSDCKIDWLANHEVKIKPPNSDSYVVYLNTENWLEFVGDDTRYFSNMVLD